MYKSATLVPAYGRDYKSKKEVLADWDANKDFALVSFNGPAGRYVNKQQLADLKAAGITHLHFRYRRLEQVAVVEIK